MQLDTPQNRAGKREGSGVGRFVAGSGLQCQCQRPVCSHQTRAYLSPFIACVSECIRATTVNSISVSGVATPCNINIFQLHITVMCTTLMVKLLASEPPLRQLLPSQCLQCGSYLACVLAFVALLWLNIAGILFPWGTLGVQQALTGKFFWSQL